MNLLDEMAYFESYIKNINPFFYDERSDNFLKYLFDILDKQKPIVSCKQDSVWFRAQTLCDGCLEYDGDRMGAPPSEMALSGRAAPAGIPVLYMANKIENAILEVRPEQNQKVQIAYFVLKKDLKIINFDILSDAEKHFFNDRAAIELINAQFSKSLDIKNENLEDYLLTQILSMRAKSLGHCDGISYSSAQIKEMFGKLPVTLVLFDPKNASLSPENVKLHIETFDLKSEWVSKSDMYSLTQRYTDRINSPNKLAPSR